MFMFEKTRPDAWVGPWTCFGVGESIQNYPIRRQYVAYHLHLLRFTQLENTSEVGCQATDAILVKQSKFVNFMFSGLGVRDRSGLDAFSFVVKCATSQPAALLESRVVAVSENPVIVNKFNKV